MAVLLPMDCLARGLLLPVLAALRALLQRLQLCCQGQPGRVCRQHGHK